ncbi:unnamed protein product [Toxocara canis]|uniref:Protein kinase domain-containing protein n=1 Tax=Toxocara canis TaxID=6265 RepID=A0A183UF93_TOXCA|nr:unnamed protein product [Toxocara canis]
MVQVYAARDVCLDISVALKAVARAHDRAHKCRNATWIDIDSHYKALETAMTNHEEASPSAASRTESSEQLQSNINDDASSANSASDVDANITSGSAEKRVHKCRADFIFLDELGEGSFSTVSRAREKSTDREFAIKVCYKKMIIRERKVHQIYREKEERDRFRPSVEPERKARIGNLR